MEETLWQISSFTMAWGLTVRDEGEAIAHNGKSLGLDQSGAIHAARTMLTSRLPQLDWISWP